MPVPSTTTKPKTGTTTKSKTSTSSSSTRTSKGTTSSSSSSLPSRKAVTKTPTNTTKKTLSSSKKAAGGGTSSVAKKKVVSKKKKKELTPEEKKQLDAALTIQSCYRGHRTRRTVEEGRRKEEERKRARDEELEKLRQAAWLADLEYTRKMEAKERKKAEEERKRRKELERVRKLMLEAAFDGETSEMAPYLDKGFSPDLADAHGNTLLSEAAAGGQPETVQLLLTKNANPNSIGEFGRTPLWRASFLGKEEIILTLLEGGADPRIANESGEVPLHVCNSESIRNIIAEWDEAEMDRLVRVYEERKEVEREEKAAAHAEVVRESKNNLEKAYKDNSFAQRQLLVCHQEVEKRIHEYDTCVGEGKSEELIQVAKNQIHAAEEELEGAKEKARRTSEALAMAKLALREQQQGQDGGAGSEEVTLPGISVDLRELDDILFKDVGNRLKEDGRPPFIIDPSGRTSVFLQYADTNHINALSKNSTEPTRLRRSVLGAIRYGKPLVLDMMEVKMWDRVVDTFNAVCDNLLQLIMSRQILKDEAYLELRREADGEEYEPNKFQESRMDKFKFVVLSQTRNWDNDFLESFYTVSVKIQGN